MVRASVSVVHRVLPVVLALVLLPFVAACSVEDVLPVPSCEEGDSAILVAQSVPSAELVPCFDPLPAGWHADTVEIDQGGTVIVFDSDRAGDTAATFHFEESCDIGPAVNVPSDHEGAERFDDVERVYPSIRGQQYYLFDGGCAWWEVDFDDDAPAALAIELGDRLAFVSRDLVDESLRESFIGEGL